MVSVQIEILKPFNDGQNIGDIRKMEKKGAELYEKEGLVKIIKTEKTKTKKKEFMNPNNENLCVVKQIYDRHKETDGFSFIEIISFDDKKKIEGSPNQFFNLSIKSPEDLIKKAEQLNKDTFGVYLNINPLEKTRRKKADIKKIFYTFIDLDHANKDHNELIKTKLKELKMTYSYNCQSGHGYHLLVPLNLPIEDEDKVKGFLRYLKNKTCDKVDTATGDNTRLMRFPLSMHHKDELSKKLITFHSHSPTAEEIENNNKAIKKYQIGQIKGKKDIEYINSIKKDDIFFCSILSSPTEIAVTEKILNKATNRNGVFMKNISCFGLNNPDKENLITSFLEQWEATRVPAYYGWQKKAKQDNYNINYPELLKWAIENKIKTWENLLKNQLKSSFLDKYEFYYLEDEKKESAFLLYYPEKNYYVTKSINEVLLTIYYDCKENGLDLIDEFNLVEMEKWDEKNFKEKLGTILATIYYHVESENRIRKVFNINYQPSDDKFIEFEGKKFFNTYNKTSTWDIKLDKKEFHFPNIKNLLFNLTGEKECQMDWFNKWLGWQIQNPIEKLPTAVIFQGRQGSGKGTFKSLILDKIFGNNCQEINQTHLEGSFNEYLLGKQIIIANEVMHNENRQTLPNVLKNLVTDPEITISRKFKKEIKGNNYTHWIFCTNSDNPIKIDEDDRRYSVFFSKKLGKGNKTKAKEIITNLRKNIDYEIQEYISYLKNLKIDFFDVHEPINTKAKDEIIELNRDSIARFIEYLKNFNNLEQAFYPALSKGIQYIEKMTGEGEKTILTDIFYLLYKDYCERFGERGIFNKQTFSKKMRSLNIENSVKYIAADKNSQRVYPVEAIETIIKEDIKLK